MPRVEDLAQDVTVLILGGGRGTRLHPLTMHRSKPAVPIAGKYRLIDIPISNAINSHMQRMYVLTQFNSVSLHRHIGRTYRFDAFSSGYVQILAAQQTEGDSTWFQGTADAVRQNQRVFEQIRGDFVLILAGDHLYRMDYRDLLADLMLHDADVAIGVMPCSEEEIADFGAARVNEDGYLVPNDQDLGRELRSALKKSATIFYAWVIYTQLSSADDATTEGEILGAGRQMTAITDFDPSDPRVRDALDFYAQLEQATRAAGSDLLVVYFPLSYAIHREDVSRWEHLGVKDVAAQMAFDAAFVRHLRERDIDAFDATPDLQQAAMAGERLYYWLDIHWTPIGNEITARAVASHLLDSPQSGR